MNNSMQFPRGTSVIIVSDLHLGLEDQENVSRDSAVFFTYLGTLKKKGAPGEHQTIFIEGKPRELYVPEENYPAGRYCRPVEPKKRHLFERGRGRGTRFWPP